MDDARPTMVRGTLEWSPPVIFRETPLTQESLQVGQLRLPMHDHQDHDDDDITHHNHHDNLICPYRLTPPENNLPKLRLHIEETDSTTTVAITPLSPPLSSSFSSSSPSTPTSSTELHHTYYSPRIPSLKTPRVHFRSRVRIASGLRHSRHRLFADSAAPKTSRSSSPSSSISAPLRSSDSDASSSPLWGSLGKRVSLLAWRRMHNRGMSNDMSREECERLHKGGERTPLLGPILSSAVYDQHDDMFDTDLGAEEEEDRLAQEMDVYFGKWPGRLLNYHWWWWQLEPFICCLYADESDMEH